jgi:hypothetical protein
MTSRRFREFRQYYCAYPPFGFEVSNLLPFDSMEQIPNIDADISLWQLSTDDLETEQ